MMVAAIVGSREFSLAVDSSAEFARPHDKCVIQHAALLEIEDQPGRRLIDAFALQGNVSRQIVMLIPAAMVKLNEAHAALGQPSREEAIGRVGTGLARIRTI